MMGYNNRFVLCVLINGVPQKELANGECRIPFNSSYSLRLRNRHNRAAAVKIYIDGENVSGAGYRVPANDKIDIHRYAEKDATFKFVDLDSPDAMEFGKNGPNPDKVKGLIEARFYLEKEVPAPKKVEHHHHHHYHPGYGDVLPIRPLPYNPKPHYRPWDMHKLGKKADYEAYLPGESYPGDSYVSPSSMNMCDADVASAACEAVPMAASEHPKSMMVSTCGIDSSRSLNVGSPAVLPTTNLREGATVEGDASGQTFSKVAMDLETDYVSVKVFLKGYDVQTKVEEVVDSVKKPNLTPSAKRFCSNCGTGVLSSANFCCSCGHKLG